jgi:hypothetical protein
MKSLFVAFLLSVGIIFSACSSPETTTPVEGTETDTLLVAPPDSTTQTETGGNATVGTDTTAVAQ